MSDKWFENIADVVENTRRFVGRTANLMMCITYFEIGRRIVEQEQSGERRAKYGEKMLKELSLYLTERFGKGFSLSTLKTTRVLYKTYVSIVNKTSYTIGQTMIAQMDTQKSQAMLGQFKNEKGQSLIDQLENGKEQAIHVLLPIDKYPFKLSWTHYLLLIKIKNDAERSFYEIEAYNSQWSYRHLQRQYNSSLYERLALSRDKDDIMRLANEGLVIEKPSDIIKNPFVLEYLDLREETRFTVTDLETAIINKLSNFLLEMGKGFLFEARQKRFTFDEDHFIVDLVFYNRLLQCYV